MTTSKMVLEKSLKLKDGKTAPITLIRGLLQNKINLRKTRFLFILQQPPLFYSSIAFWRMISNSSGSTENFTKIFCFG